MKYDVLLTFYEFQMTLSNLFFFSFFISISLLETSKIHKKTYMFFTI